LNFECLEENRLVGERLLCHLVLPSAEPEQMPGPQYYTTNRNQSGQEFSEWPEFALRQRFYSERFHFPSEPGLGKDPQSACSTLRNARHLCSFFTGDT